MSTLTPSIHRYPFCTVNGDMISMFKANIITELINNTPSKLRVEDFLTLILKSTGSIAPIGVAQCIIICINYREIELDIMEITPDYSRHVYHV